LAADFAPCGWVSAYAEAHVCGAVVAVQHLWCCAGFPSAVDGPAASRSLRGAAPTVRRRFHLLCGGLLGHGEWSSLRSGVAPVFRALPVGGRAACALVFRALRVPSFTFGGRFRGVTHLGDLTPFHRRWLT